MSSGCIGTLKRPAIPGPVRRAGKPPPDALRVCTLQLSRSLDVERERSHRLSDLCLRYGVPLTRAHDAAADAAATAALLPRLLAEAGITDLSQLAPYGAGRTTSWLPGRAQR